MPADPLLRRHAATAGGAVRLAEVVPLELAREIVAEHMATAMTAHPSMPEDAPSTYPRAYAEWRDRVADEVIDALILLAEDAQQLVAAKAAPPDWDERERELAEAGRRA